MKRVWVSFLVFMLLLLSACQPTPEKNIVANKNDSSYIAATASDINPFSDVPNEYDLTFASDDQSVVVNINASVSAPSIDQIPLAALTPRMFTQDEIDAIINALMQNQPLYKPRTPEEYSKDELLEIILELESGTNSDLYKVDPDAYYDQIKDELDMYKELYTTASDEGTTTPASTELQTRSNGTSYVSLIANLGKENPASFSYTDKDTQYDVFTFCNTPGTPPGGLATDDLDIENVRMPVEDARKLAEETVDQMGFSEFTLNGEASIPNLGNIADVTSYKEIPKCYMFYFTRSVSGLNETYANREFYNMAIKMKHERRVPKNGQYRM